MRWCRRLLCFQGQAARIAAPCLLTCAAASLQESYADEARGSVSGSEEDVGGPQKVRQGRS